MRGLHQHLAESVGTHGGHAPPGGGEGAVILYMGMQMLLLKGYIFLTKVSPLRVCFLQETVPNRGMVLQNNVPMKGVIFTVPNTGMMFSKNCSH